MDCKKLTDDELKEYRIAIMAEEERRASLAEIPATVANLAAKYAEGGGDREALIKAVGEHEQ